MGDFKQQELQQQSLKSARKICRKLDSTSKNCIKKNFFDYKLILKIDLDLKKSDRFYIFPKGHMVWMELNCFVEKSSSLKKRMSSLFVSAQYKPSGHASYYLYFIKALL